MENLELIEFLAFIIIIIIICISSYPFEKKKKIINKSKDNVLYKDNNGNYIYETVILNDEIKMEWSNFINSFPDQMYATIESSNYYYDKAIKSWINDIVSAYCPVDADKIKFKKHLVNYYYEIGK